MKNRRKQKERNKTPLAAARAILSGEESVDAGPLLALIHRINPTGSALSEQETANRYALKSQLQSLLIRNFSGSLTVVRDSRSQDLISIQHGYYPRDACHALLSELDDEARSWAQRQLDEQRGDADATQPPGSPADPLGGPVSVRGSVGNGIRGQSPQALLEQGQQALAEYDYQEAERCLMGAFEAAKEPPYALGVLDLLVNHLAQYDQALSLAKGLPRAVAAVPDVRSLLGLAAARAGRETQAVELLAGSRGPIAVDALFVLASRALDNADREVAERHIAAAERAVLEDDPATRGEFVALRSRVATLRAKERDPLEEEMQRRFEAGEIELAEAKAEEILSRWPEAKAARVLLQRIRKEQSLKRAQICLARAEHAELQGDLETAANHLREALAIGAEAEPVRARLATIERQRREQDQLAKTTVTQQLLAQEDLFAGLMAYLDLDPFLRAQLRQTTGLEALVWLEELCGGGHRPRAKERALVRAVLAMGKAAKAIAKGECEAAIALLEPHQRYLARHSKARELVRQARDGLHQQTVAWVRQQVAAVRQQLASGDALQARTALEAVDWRTLPAEEQADAERLLATATHEAETGALMLTLERQLATQELLPARETLQRLHARSAGGQAESWRDKLAEVDRRIRRAWSVRTVSPASPDCSLRDFDGGYRPCAFNAWLRADGRTLIIVGVAGKRIFIRDVEVETGRIQSWTSLQAPEELNEPLAWVLNNDERLVLLSSGKEAYLLEIALDRSQIIRWQPFSSLIAANTIVEEAALPAGGRYVWLLIRTDNEFGHVTVDLKRWRIEREVLGFIDTVPVIGSSGTEVICSSEGRVRFFTARGTPDGRELALTSIVLGASLTPGGRGLVVLTAPPDTFHGSDASDEPVAVVGLNGDGERIARYPLEDAFIDGYMRLAARIDAGLLFVIAERYEDGEGPQRDLWGFRMGANGELKLLYRTPVPQNSVFAQDMDGNHAVLLMPSEIGCDLVCLDASPPNVPAECLRLVSPQRPGFEGIFFCSLAHGGRLAQVKALTDRCKELSAEKTKRWAHRLLACNSEDPEDLINLILAMDKIWPSQKVCDELVVPALQKHPGHPGIALVAANARARRGDWQSVAELLQPFDPKAVDPTMAQHFCHLKGSALLVQGQAEEASQLFRTGLTCEVGDCHLDHHGELAEPAAAPTAPPDPLVLGSLVHVLKHLIAYADACLQRGEAGLALAALDRPVVWRGRELQSLARLAAAHLQVDPGPSAGLDLNKALALATYVHARGWSELCGSRMNSGLPFAGATWDAGKLDSLRDEARSWLEQNLGVPSA